MRYGAVIICQHHHIIIRPASATASWCSAIICSLSAVPFFARILWLMVMVYHGMFGYSKIDLFTIEGWQSGVFFFSHDHPHMCWQTEIRLRWLHTDNWQYLQSADQNNDKCPHISPPVCSYRPLDCCNYNPEISAPAPVVKMIAVTSWEIFLYLMISWEWPHTHWFPPVQALVDLQSGSPRDNGHLRLDQVQLPLPRLGWPVISQHFTSLRYYATQTLSVTTIKSTLKCGECLTCRLLSSWFLIMQSEKLKASDCKFF